MNGVLATDLLTPRHKLGRGRRTPGQLWQVPTFFVGLFVFILVAASAPYRELVFDSTFSDDLQGLRRDLREQLPPDQLVARAERLLEQLPKHPRKQAEVHFLAGSAFFRLAEAEPKNERARARAIELLEEALAQEVAGEDLPSLQQRLGVLLYRQGTDLPRALDLLAHGLEQRPENAEHYRLLIEGYLALPTPNVDAALAASRKLLEASGDSEAVGRARLIRGELLLRKQQRLDAIKELDRIQTNVSRGLRARARLLQAEACGVEQLWNRAASLWKELLSETNEVPGGKGRVLYELGHCYASADPPNHGAAAHAWHDALALGGPEAQAAALRLGELRLFHQGDPGDQALTHWQTALQNVSNAAAYDNPYLDLGRVQAIFDHACEHFLELHDHTRLQKVAQLYQKLAAPGVAEERIGTAAEAMALELQKQASQGGPLAAQQSEQARGHFRNAGRAFEQAAVSREAKERVEAYWRSAICYLAAKDFSKAADVLEKFVTLDKDEPRLAEAWYSLADAHIAQGHKDKAYAAYYKCMEFPATKYAFRARFQLALEEIEKKNFQHAKEILKQNLTAASPTLDREAHEKSIYKMAGLLLQMQAYDEAAWYLKEASRQYPAHPNALHARDLLADSYLRLAGQAERKLAEMETARQDELAPERALALEDLKTHHRRTRRALLEQAIEVYQGLAEELEQRIRQRPLAAPELDMMRRALFGIADTRFELNEFNEALKAYQNLQQRYRGQVEGLMACQRIWRCVGVMTEPPEQARFVRAATQAALELARSDLGSMPEDSPGFRGRGCWSKQEWSNWITWVGSKLTDPPTSPPSRPNPLASTP